jgi:hypothetical protein
MKTYIVTETKPVISIYTYTVEANNEEEALHKVMNNDYLSVEKELEEHMDIDDSNWDVYEEGNG